jgi:hypothetical protein
MTVAKSISRRDPERSELHSLRVVQLLRSVMAQREHGIDASGAARGQVAGKQRDRA